MIIIIVMITLIAGIVFFLGRQITLMAETNKNNKDKIKTYEESKKTRQNVESLAKDKRRLLLNKLLND